MTSSKIATNGNNGISNGANDHRDWDINDSHFPKLQIVIIYVLNKQQVVN